MIPFKSGMFVAGPDFCGRKQEIKSLKADISSNARVNIQGERRIGKSSLILETIRKCPKYKPLYIDLLGVKSENDISRRIISGILTFEKNDSFIIKIMKVFANLRPSLSVDPFTNQPIIGIATETKIPPQTIEKSFDVIKTLKNPVVVFDEFQDILNISESHNMIAILRSKIQSHNKICYIFAGSVRNKMFEIFNSPDFPFFKSALSLNVGPIEEKLFTQYIKNKFLIGKRNIDNETIKAIYKFTYNNPGDIQRLCFAIWEISSYGEKITEMHIPQALGNINAMNERMYEIIVPALSGQQLNCLKTVAENGGSTKINKKFVEKTGINIEVSVRKAMNRLVDKRMVIKIGTTYKICDPFFGNWISSKNI